MENTSFKTITEASGEVIFKEQGSKFIGIAIPIKSVEDAETKLEEIREAHPKATHHCYAYRLNPDGDIYRTNDDGEPSNSAGMPIYNQLLSDELTNILVVVIRYYGGTKLGVGGLITAYREAARQAIGSIRTIICEITEPLTIHFPYEQTSAVKKLLSNYDLTTTTEKFAAACEFSLQIPIRIYDEVVLRVKNMKDIVIKD